MFENKSLIINLEVNKRAHPFSQIRSHISFMNLYRVSNIRVELTFDQHVDKDI